MILFDLFRKPTDTAELRDRAIIAETKAVLLENALEVERCRRGRERRRDATDIARAIAARAQVYSDRFAHLTDDQRRRAIQQAKRGRG